MAMPELQAYTSRHVGTYLCLVHLHAFGIVHALSTNGYPDVSMCKLEIEPWPCTSSTGHEGNKFTFEFATETAKLHQVVAYKT